MTALDLSHEIPQDRRRPFWRRKLISLVWMLATLGLTGLASLIFLFSAVPAFCASCTGKRDS